VAVGRQTDDRTVAEYVVLAVDQVQFVAEVEIAWVKPAVGSIVGVHAGVPFTALHDKRGVRNLRIAAAMVEMEMRVDQQIDFAGIVAERLQSSTDLLAGMVVEREQAGEARPETAGRVVLTVRMHAGVEQGRPFRVLDQKGRDRQPDATLAPVHQAGGRNRLPASRRSTRIP
jgi:hypothetical protein